MVTRSNDHAADIHSAMSRRDETPKVLELLPAMAGASVDFALVEALPAMSPAARSQSLELLIHRGHVPALALLIQRISSYEPHVKEAVLRHRPELAGGVRYLTTSPSRKQRLVGIRAITDYGIESAVDVLADALRIACSETRTRAGEVLYSLATDIMKPASDNRPAAGPIETQGAQSESRQRASTVRKQPDSPSPHKHVTDALTAAMRIWDVHRSPIVLAACALVGPEMFPALSAWVDQPRSQHADEVRKIIEGTSEPALAPLVLWAATVPALRAVAVRTIAKAQNPAFVYRVLACGALIRYVAERRCLQLVRSTTWGDCLGDELNRLHGELARNAVELVTATAGDESAVVASLRELVRSGDADMRRAVVEALTRLPSDAATAMLSWIAGSHESDISPIAWNELDRRRAVPSSGSDSRATASEEALDDVRAAAEAFQRCWDTFDRVDTDERDTLLQALRPFGSYAVSKIQGKLRSGAVDQRIRALRLIRHWGAPDQFDRDLYRLARDADPFVRSLAVAMLPQLPGPTTKRILRDAARDGDARVCANAVEAIDQLSTDSGQAVSPELLDSADCRVRANAVKALLRMESARAGETLLDMLEDGKRSHRISALWVVQRMKLRSLVERIRQMATNDRDELVRRRAVRVCNDLQIELPLTVDRGLRRIAPPSAPSSTRQV